MQDAQSFPRAVLMLKKMLGRDLTAYVAGVCDPGRVDLWTTGFPDPGIEKRVCLAYRLAIVLCMMDQCDEVRSWFLTPQARLEDLSPAMLIREGGDRDDVAAAVVLSAMGAKYN
jgi:hypothetical protein